MKKIIILIGVPLCIIMILANCIFYTNDPPSRKLRILLPNEEHTNMLGYTEVEGLVSDNIVVLELGSELNEDYGYIFIYMKANSPYADFRIDKFNFSVIEKTGKFGDLKETHRIQMSTAIGESVDNTASYGRIEDLRKEEIFSSYTNLINIAYRIGLADKNSLNLKVGSSLTVEIDLKYETEGELWELKKTEKIVVGQFSAGSYFIE